MGFFTLAKRCNFCAHKLDKDGNCVNPSCIAYVKPATAETPETGGKGNETNKK